MLKSESAAVQVLTKFVQLVYQGSKGSKSISFLHNLSNDGLLPINSLATAQRAAAFIEPDALLHNASRFELLLNQVSMSQFQKQQGDDNKRRVANSITNYITNFLVIQGVTEQRIRDIIRECKVQEPSMVISHGDIFYVLYFNGTKNVKLWVRKQVEYADRWASVLPAATVNRTSISNSGFMMPLVSFKAGLLGQLDRVESYLVE